MEIIEKFEIKDKEFGFRKLTNKESMNLDIRYKAEYANALRQGCCTIVEIDKMIKDRDLNDSHDIKQKEEIVKELIQLENDLEDKKKNKDEKTIIATRMSVLRHQFVELSGKLQNLYDVTAETSASEARQRSAFVVCFVDITSGKQYFESEDEFNNAEDVDEVTEAFSKFMYMIYNIDPKFEHSLPENQWLVENEVLDKDLNFLEQNLKPKKPKATRKKKSTKTRKKKKATVKQDDK